MSIVALIPARGGSERIPGKNLRELNGHPLLAYAIAGAKRARIFDGIYVSTEDKKIAEMAKHYGAEVIDRPAMYAAADSPDIEWVRHAAERAFTGRMHYWADLIVILRPTNPFRTWETIRRAISEWEVRTKISTYSSMRSVEVVGQHPNKMWRSEFEGSDRIIKPYAITGWHDLPTQSLPRTFVQNGCIQSCYKSVLGSFSNYTGTKVAPFFTEGYEGLDLNTEEDWILAEALLERGLATLEVIE